MLHRFASFALFLSVAAVPTAFAHDAPGSTDFEMPIPPGPYDSQITFVTLIGPPGGAQVLHTDWDVTFSSGPAGTPASDVLFELSVVLDTGSVSWLVSGADLGWPSATGTFEGTLSSDMMNGVLVGGLFPFTTPTLDIGATSGGLTGQFINSTVTFEIAGGNVCQADLGFGGPGNVDLSICGESLASGNTASLEVTGAPASSFVYLVLGLTNSPTPFFGGTLVPVPPLAIRAFAADATGTLQLTVPGGGGPVTGYLQAVTVDGSVLGGYGISNALEVDFLP